MLLRYAIRVLLAVGLLAGCAGAGTTSPAVATDAVVVSSFDFGESAVVAEIYAQALENARVPVRRELRLGPRELVLPALRQGLVDVVPEYVGTALATVAPSAPAAADTAAAVAELAIALRPDGLRPLQPAPAQNQNGLAVTRATAQRLGLRTTSDLRGRAGRLTLTGPSECSHREYCAAGLRAVYGLTFSDVVPYDLETQRVTALEQGLADVAVVFTTDGLLRARDLVLLADDRHLQPVENVVPVVSERSMTRYGPRVAETLDRVSARLDSAGLALLNWRVDVAHADARDEARSWLQQHALLSG